MLYIVQWKEGSKTVNVRLGNCQIDFEDNYIHVVKYLSGLGVWKGLLVGCIFSSPTL